jgi:hypothetical protein
MVLLFAGVWDATRKPREGEIWRDAVDAAYVVCALSKAAYNYEF